MRSCFIQPPSSRMNRGWICWKVCGSFSSCCFSHWIAVSSFRTNRSSWTISCADNRLRSYSATCSGRKNMPSRAGKRCASPSWNSAAESGTVTPRRTWKATMRSNSR